jgi:hypothetical protein
MKKCQWIAFCLPSKLQLCHPLFFFTDEKQQQSNQTGV